VGYIKDLEIYGDEEMRATNKVAVKVQAVVKAAMAVEAKVKIQLHLLQGKCSDELLLSANSSRDKIGSHREGPVQERSHGVFAHQSPPLAAPAPPHFKCFLSVVHVAGNSLKIISVFIVNACTAWRNSPGLGFQFLLFLILFGDC